MIKMIKKTKWVKNKLIFFYLYYHHVVCFSLSDYSMQHSLSPVVPSNTGIFIKPSEAFNRGGIRNYLLYLPAFKPNEDRTIDNVIPHWTHGLQSFFVVPKMITMEWFRELVGEINEINLENGANPATHFVTRDGDSFIQNVLTPNVEQVCQNVCVPRGNLDGSLIEMFMAGANMVTSESVMKTWQALVKETIVKCSCNAKEEEECSKDQDPTCDCEMCDFYRDDSYSRSTSTTDCSGDPFCNSDTDSDWE
jgi:hypothetical protein